MSMSSILFRFRKGFPVGVAIFAVVLMLFLEHVQGRQAFCACNSLFPWSGDIWSAHNSQHLFDPYSVTHILHGVLFCGMLTLLFPKWSGVWRCSVAVAMEALWEVMENSPFIIQRYREATFALGYEGDTLLNSMGDVGSCLLGFLLALRLGWRNSIILFVLLEVIMLFWIKDNLSLNVLMLICPIDAVKAWQMAH